MSYFFWIRIAITCRFLDVLKFAVLSRSVFYTYAFRITFYIIGVFKLNEILLKEYSFAIWLFKIYKVYTISFIMIQSVFDDFQMNKSNFLYRI